MIHPAWSLTAAHCIPGNSWTARSAELLAALSVLGRNDVSNITEEDLENIGMTRLEADELAREGSVNFTGESFNFQIIFGLHDLKNPTNAKVSSLNHKYITTHPRFHNPSPYNNDIAIIKHKEEFTDYLFINVSPILKDFRVSFHLSWSLSTL